MSLPWIKVKNIKVEYEKQVANMYLLISHRFCTFSKHKTFVCIVCLVKLQKLNGVE